MEPKFTGVYINLLRSRQIHVIYCDYFYPALVHTTLLFVTRGGGGVELSLRFIISSPTWAVLCFSVMSGLNLDNPGYQSLGVPPPAPPSSSSSSDYVADRRTCLTCHGWLSMTTFDRRTLCLFRQNTYLQNKKHTLTCQGGDWLLQI